MKREDVNIPSIVHFSSRASSALYGFSTQSVLRSD
jgi:hypothetical protein